jgi:hypothetical protein
MAPQFANCRQPDAQSKPELARRQAAHSRQLTARRIRMLRRHHDDRSVTAEQERNRLRSTKVLQRSDRHRGDEVDRLVATVGNGDRRVHDVGDRQCPVVRRSAVVRVFERVPGTFENRQAGEETHAPPRLGVWAVEGKSLMSRDLLER